jgi:hypothetical protein
MKAPRSYAKPGESYRETCARHHKRLDEYRDAKVIAACDAAVELPRRQRHWLRASRS